MQENPELNDELEIPDELTTLKARADKMGLSYHPSIGLEKLRAKVAAALEGKTDESGDEENAAANSQVPAAPVAETENQRRLRKKREAGELIRIRVTCMNPNKRDWDGEIFSAGNSTVGTFKKYVPFNADEGWYVPRIIYNMIVQRMCQVFVVKKTARGVSIKEGKQIREFAVEVLPNLTEEELHDLAQRQAMAKSID